ncbi:class I SAM-dependent methyltransferase [Candidatus Pacearchaeota archaeon]|nr:class I SAM-dependent methyltransferase [Candidatus Pacearchaeota archaeon]
MKTNVGWDIGSLVYDLFTGKVDEQLYLEVLLALGTLDGIKLDEFGCGTGNLTGRLPETTKIRAVDYSPIAIAKAKQKTSKNVGFFIMDFYQEQPNGYKPDKIVACRSLYHSDLSLSLGILSRHLGDGGEAIIAHPTENWRKYVTPIVNGKREFNFVQFVKSNWRFANRMGVPYALFSADEFERVGKQHFDEVIINSAGYDTHYLVQLRKRAFSKK